MRILFSTNPLVGHWFPMIPLARAASGAGHEVVVAAGPDLVPDVERRGFAAWSVGPDLATIQAGLQGRQRKPDESEQERIAGDGMAMFAVPAIDRARDLRALTRNWRPDVVVREIYELGARYVPAGLHVLHGLGAHYPRFLELTELAEQRVADVLGPPEAGRSAADTPYVDPFPDALQPPDDQPFTDVIAIRPDAGDVLPGDRLPDRIDALPHERTVYLTLGTLFNAVEEFSRPLAALSELDVNVVLTCGRGVQPGVFGPLPPHVLVEQYIPQALLLPRVDAVVCHAGAGTVVGALSHGVPLVCLPRGADQFGNAEQVARTGSGLALGPGEASPEALRGAVRRVLDDPSYEDAARDVQRQIETMPDPATVVEELAARR